MFDIRRLFLTALIGAYSNCIADERIGQCGPFSLEHMDVDRVLQYYSMLPRLGGESLERGTRLCAGTQRRWT